MSAARPSKAVIRNAIEAWEAAGWPPGRLIIRNGEAIIEPLPEGQGFHGRMGSAERRPARPADERGTARGNPRHAQAERGYIDAEI